jgi:hypothetical protein
MELVGAITNIHSFEKGEYTMKRLRHLALTAQQGGQIRAEEQQARPIYDTIATALRDGDILGFSKYDDRFYEDTVVWLTQHLKPLSDYNDVERLLLQAFAAQQGSHQFDPEDVLRMQALAEDIWHAWSQYQQRHEPSALTQQTHTKSRMRQHYYPMSNSR